MSDELPIGPNPCCHCGGEYGEHQPDCERVTHSLQRPCSVERTSRDVIEHKLLTALEDGGVAALLSKQDLEDLVFACKLWPMRDSMGTRLGSLQRGMEQLLSEAFPRNDKTGHETNKTTKGEGTIGGNHYP